MAPAVLESTELSREDLQILVKTGAELAGQLDLRVLLHNILERAGELTNSPDGCVLLYHDHRGGLYFADAIGENAGTLLQAWGEDSPQLVPVQGSKAGAVFTSGESMVIDSIGDDPEHFKGVDRQTQHETKSMVCVPLTADGVRLGAMQMLNKRSGNYSARDRVLLEHFANQAAIAIRNARLIQDVLARMGLLTSPQESTGALELLTQLSRSSATSEHMTLLFADMRGFTQLSQVLNSPDTILRFLNEFLGMLSEEVVKHGGIVNKFLGDGVLALFRQNDYACRAVKCAFAMVERFEALRQRWDQQTNVLLDFLDIGIGISTDNVIIGTVGSARVRDFTAIGTAVILAAAFEKCARGGKRILVDRVTYGAVKTLVAEVEGPLTYTLRKADQEIGHPYSQYHLKSLTPAVHTRAFISHSHLDRAFVERELVAPLARLGIETWYSVADIKPGDRWVGSITEGLARSDVVLVIVSEHSAASQWVKTEIEMAAASGRFADRIIPIVLDGTSPGQVHPFLNHLQNIQAGPEGAIADRICDVLKPPG